MFILYSLYVPQVHQLRLQQKAHMYLHVNNILCISTILCFVLILYSLHAPQVYQLRLQLIPHTDLQVNPLLCTATILLFAAHPALPSCTTGVPTQASTKSPYGTSSKRTIVVVTTKLSLVFVLHPFMHHRHNNTRPNSRSTCNSWYVKLVVHQPL